MTIQASDFTSAFPEFANANTFPSGQVTFWIGQGYANMPACRLGTSLDLAVMLYTAHNLVVAARDAKAVSAGGLPGQVSGPVSSKSVAGVSVSYDTGSLSIPGAGSYDATLYGQRLYQMLKGAAAGPAYRPTFFGSLPYPGRPF